VPEIAAPHLPQNLPAAGAAAGKGGAGSGDPQMPQNFSDPLAGLPQVGHTRPP